MSSQVFSVNGLVPADGTVEELVKLGKKGSYREDALEGSIVPFELSSPVSRPPELSSFVHCMFTPQCSPLPQTQEQCAVQTWAETSETMSPDESSSFRVVYL